MEPVTISEVSDSSSAVIFEARRDRVRSMTPETLGYINLAGIVAVIAFLWSLHRDMRSMDGRINDLARELSELRGEFRGRFGPPPTAEDSP